MPANNKHPQTNYQALFRLYSWWQAVDGRMFMVVQRWLNFHGKVMFIDLVEQHKEGLIRREFRELITLFEQGKMKPTSTLPVESLEHGWPGGQVLPEYTP